MTAIHIEFLYSLKVMRWGGQDANSCEETVHQELSFTRERGHEGGRLQEKGKTRMKGKETDTFVGIESESQGKERVKIWKHSFLTGS